MGEVGPVKILLYNKIMKYLITLILTGLNYIAQSQQVYMTNNRYEADYIIYITNNKYDADNLIYVTDNKYEAGWPCEEIGATRCGRWYFTDSKYQANIKIYITNNRYQADRKIYYTTNKYEAHFEQ